MRRFLALVLALVMICSLSATAFAADDTDYQVTYSNEYDYIVMLQNSTPEKLAELGMTPADVTATVDAFYEALAQRATLPDETLIGYGYTPNEIKILRSYNPFSRTTANTDLKKTEDLRAITGTLTGRIKLTNCGTKYATFRYEWSWDHSPIMTLKDSAAMRWLAYDTNGYELDLIKTSETVNIDYYWNATYKFSRTGSQEPNLEFNSINVQFEEAELFQSPTTMTEQAYAKCGTIKVSLKVDDSVSNQINYIKVAALYGHTIIGANFPSISLSPTGSISISFSGNLSINKIGGHKVKIGKGSTIEDI